MIYIFGGVGKTGCSTLAIDFAEQFQLRRVYGGAYMKSEALKAGFVRQGYVVSEDQNEWDLDKADVPAFREMCLQERRDIDREIEIYLLREMLTSQEDSTDLVVESKTMSRLLNSEVADPLITEAAESIGLQHSINRGELLTNTKAIWVHADPEVRALRAVSKAVGIQGEGRNTSLEPASGLIQQETLLLNARQLADRADYSRIYGMYDYPVGGDIPPLTYGTPLINNGDKESAYAQVLQIMGKVE